MVNAFEILVNFLLSLANVFGTKMNLSIIRKKPIIRIVTCFGYVVYVNIEQSWIQD